MAAPRHRSPTRIRLPSTRKATGARRAQAAPLAGSNCQGLQAAGPAGAGLADDALQRQLAQFIAGRAGERQLLQIAAGAELHVVQRHAGLQLAGLQGELPLPPAPRQFTDGLTLSTW